MNKNILENDLENMKRYLTVQIQGLNSNLKYDQKLPVDRRMEEKTRNQLNVDLMGLKKEREEILQKIKRFRTDSLHLQARKSLEELSGPNNVVDKIISDAKKKPLSLLSLPVFKKKKTKKT